MQYLLTEEEYKRLGPDRQEIENAAKREVGERLISFVNECIKTGLFGRIHPADREQFYALMRKHNLHETPTKPTVPV